MLRLFPILTIAMLVGPVIMGLAYIVGPAFNIAPFTGVPGFSLAAFDAAWHAPGFGISVWLSFWMGPVTALISLLLVVLFTAAFSGSRLFQVMVSAIRPVLAIPHAAAAFGLAFLIAPSGFIMRVVSPGLTGFDRPPDWLILNDPAGFALLFGLVAKEVPFIFLVTLAALPQADERRAIVARALGYGEIWAWLTAVFPAVYQQIRLPVYAVIAFATSVVDVSLILGPGTPAPLAIRILQWMNDPDLSLRANAAAAALIQIGVTLAALGLWRLGEMLVAHWGLRIATGGHRYRNDRALRWFAALGPGLTSLAILGGIAVLALWSISGLWRFPEILPRYFTYDTWMREARSLVDVSLRAILIALAASGIGLVLVLGCLENEYRQQIKLSPWARFLLYLPLLVPQIAFLTGLSVWMLRTRLDGHIWSVVLAHLIFVLPYIYLTLSDPWTHFDQRYLAVGRTLGKSEAKVFFSIRIPMLLRPILTAFALGFAISIAQYLPTLLIGAGRLPTITTEAVALASGGNRRLIGVYALVQTLLPFVMFALATLIPAYLWRDRRALKPGYVA